MSFPQVLSALIAAHFNRLAAYRDLDGVCIELTITSCTSFLKHEILLEYPRSG
jgi:hypothetical protein